MVAGTVSVTGRAAANGELEIVDENGQILGTTTANSTGRWSVDLELNVADTVTITAQMVDDSQVQSETVTFIVAPVIQPRTGISLTPEAENERGAGYTALLALLLTAFGFALIYAGRLIYMLAQRNNDDGEEP